MIPGRGVEITELMSDDENLDSHIIPEEHEDDVESHIIHHQEPEVMKPEKRISEEVEEILEAEITSQVIPEQQQKPDRISEESEPEEEEEVVKKEDPIEADDESLPIQTPISLASGDQSERVNNTNGHHSGVDAEELVNTRIYGDEIVDDIITEAMSRVNDLPPPFEEDLDYEEEEIEHHPATEKVISHRDSEDDVDNNEQIEEHQTRQGQGDTEDITPPGEQDDYEPVEIPEPDSEEPSTNSDPITKTPPEVDIQPVPQDEDSPAGDIGGDVEGDEMDSTTPQQASGGAASAPGGKKKKGKKKGKKSGGGNGNGT